MQCTILTTFKDASNQFLLPLNAPMHACSVASCVQLFATPWTGACQVPLTMRFFPARILERVAPGDLPDPRIKPTSLAVSCTDRQIFFYHQHHLISPLPLCLLEEAFIFLSFLKVTSTGYILCFSTLKISTHCSFLHGF